MCANEAAMRTGSVQTVLPVFLVFNLKKSQAKTTHWTHYYSKDICGQASGHLHISYLSAFISDAEYIHCYNGGFFIQATPVTGTECSCSTVAATRWCECSERKWDENPAQ